MRTIILKAIDAYDSIPDEEPSQRQLRAYLEALLQAGQGILDVIVHGQCGRNPFVWTPFREPIITWLRKEKPTKLFFRTTASYEFMRNGARSMIAAQILSAGEHSLVNDPIIGK